MSSKHWPKISIVTPNYNLGAFMERTLLSVLNQEYPNLEYIVIDGGSTDQSLEIIEKYAPRLSYWISEKDKGMYDALNKGFAKASGEIMGWINSDDMLHPRSLFKIAAYFSQHPRVQWIQGYPNVFDIHDKIIYERPPQYEQSFFLLKGFVENCQYVQQESTFWRRSLWEKSGASLSTKYKAAGDFELWLRFFHQSPMYCVRERLGGFRSRPEQLSGNQSAYQEEAIKAVDEYLAHLTGIDKLKWQLKKATHQLRIMVNRPSFYREPKYLGLKDTIN